MAETQIAAGSGLRNIRAWLIDSSGYPSGDQSGINGYDGFLIDKAKSFTANVTDPELVTHRGNDEPWAQDILPPSELENATLTTSVTNLSADAALGGTKVEDISATVVMGGLGTNNQGCEPDVAIMVWRKALGGDSSDTASYGKRRYITYIYPSARVFAAGGGAEESSDDVNNYTVAPTKVGQTPWGVVFTSATNGFTQTQRMRLISTGPLMMESFVTSGAVATFNLQKAPISAARTKVWFYGSPQTVSSVDVNNKTFTLDGNPNASTDARLVALYETTEACI